MLLQILNGVKYNLIVIVLLLEIVININLLNNKYLYIMNVYNKCKVINLDMDMYQVKVGKLKKYNKKKK